jgi:hypothetical protein
VDGSLAGWRLGVVGFGEPHTLAQEVGEAVAVM